MRLMEVVGRCEKNVELLERAAEGDALLPEGPRCRTRSRAVLELDVGC